MAAIYAYEIDNLLIQVNEGEPPIADGSALPFLELIDSAGIKEQKAATSTITLPAPLSLSYGDTHLVVLPANEFRISYTLHYPQSSVIRSQYQSLVINPESFRTEIAPCRTFALYEEINALMELGLIRGGSLENAVVIKDGVVLSKGGIRFPDEHVRHKILDLVGDLALMGIRLHAHVIAIRSGHMTNVALGKAIIEALASMQKKSSLVEKNVFHTL
jgi:UDP-3-O-[3-hydroxymyristoyl] N-acetylglucosamine deacetylase